MPANPNPTSKPEAPTICDNYNSHDADVELISSDNVSFKVHSVQLHSASPVLHSKLLLAPRPDQLHLTDTKFESSRILERALDIVYTLEFDYGSPVYDLEVAQSVLDFAAKWGITSIYEAIQTNLQESLNNDVAPNYIFDCFLVSIQLGNHPLAAAYYGAALKDGWIGGGADITGDSRSTHQWGKVLNVRLTDTPKPTLSQRHPLLDIPIDRKNILGSIPHDHYICIPSTVTWAIGRAQALDGEGGDSQEKVMKKVLDQCYPHNISEE